MTGFDYAIIAIFLISLSLGVWRGLVYEVLSLLGWPLAFVLSRLFAADVAPMMPGDQDMQRTALAYAAVFIVALIVWGILVWLVAKLVRAVGLGWLDSMMGALFGLLRGALVVLVLVWLGGLTRFPEQPFWRDAYSSRAVENIALTTKVWLPDNIAQRIHYRIRS
ncbi:MAG: CvpA family protein [Gallionella sp.]|nr:CvpA family protein [Gallionella sp.]